MIRTAAYHPFGADRLAALPADKKQAARQIIQNISLPAEQREKVMAAFKD
jgi:hypothetical protein